MSDSYSKEFFSKVGKDGQKKQLQELGDEKYKLIKSKARKGKFKIKK